MLNPYLAYLKLAAAIGLFVALGLVAFQVHRWHEGYLHVAAVEAQAKHDKETYRATLDSYRTAWEASQKASQGFQNDITAITADRDRLRASYRPVRVCNGNGVPPTHPTGRPDATPAGPAQEPGTSQSDIGQPLYTLTDDADERELTLGAQLRRLQDYVRSLQ